MPSLNIKVGVSVDRSLGVAWRPLVEGAKRAAVTVEAENARAAKNVARDAKRAADTTAREAARGAAAQAKASKKASDDATKAKDAEAKAFAKSEKEKTKAVEAEAKAQLRAQLASMREAEKMAKAYRKSVSQYAQLGQDRRDEASSRDRARLLSVGKAGGAIGHFAGRAAGAALGVVGSLAHGAGVETDPSALFRKNNELETIATQVSNSGLMVGDAKNGNRVDPRALMNQALSVGSETGTDANEALEALSKFTAKTGDLATGRDLLRDLAIYSKATGTNLADMADASADVATALPDTADKGQRVLAVMRAIAGQGKLGAIEIKDLATHMAKLAARAGQVGGDPSKNIAMLGSLAQEARQHGGASSAANATTSVGAFMDTFDKAARNKAFTAFGVKTRDDKGMLRGGDAIIKDAIAAAGSAKFGGMAKFATNMNLMFSSSQARKTTKGFETIFQDAGGGTEGMKKVNAEFDRLSQSIISEEEIRSSFNAALKTSQSQAEMFNGALRKSALDIQTALLPAVVALAPVMLDAAKKLAEITTSLFGPNQVEKNIEDTSGKTNDVIDSAVTQVKGGKISSATEDEMAKQEAQMRAAAMLADSEARDAKNDRMGGTKRAALETFDKTPIGALLGLIGGGGWNNGVGHAAIDHEDVDIQKKEFAAKNADRLAEEIKASNKTLHDAITRGLVVRVSNLDELGNAGGAPPGNKSGRKPSPEEKAE